MHVERLQALLPVSRACKANHTMNHQLKVSVTYSMLHDGVRYCENGKQPCGSEIQPLQCNSWHRTPSEKSSSK